MRSGIGSTGARRVIGRLFCATVLFVFALSLHASDHDEWQGPFDGQWLMEAKSATEAQLTLRYQRAGAFDWDGSYSDSNLTLLASAEGLTREQISSAGTHISFHLVREPGIFECEGWFANGKGSGHFHFAPSAEFKAELRKRGFDEPTATQQFQMALGDFRLGLLDELKAENYAPFGTGTVVRLATHGVRLEYVRAMKTAGYPFHDTEDLLRFHDHGVSPVYIGSMAEAGYSRLGAEELLSTHDHGINPEFIRSLAALGYKNLRIQEVTRAHDHGISPEFIRELRTQGYTGMNLDDIVRVHDHGVETGYIAEVKAAGFSGVGLEDLVRLHDHGVSPGFVKRHKNGRSIDEIIRLKDRGENEMD
jgi:hypothetical protein